LVQIFGVGVIIVSSILLHAATTQKCGNNYESGFEYYGDDGGVHGGNGAGGYNKGEGDYDEDGGSSSSSKSNSSYKKETKTEGKKNQYSYCDSLVLKLKSCAGVGIAGGILQILVSIIYCFATKKVCHLNNSLSLIITTPARIGMQYATAASFLYFKAR
jgi:hypothetical protein